jgi:hypothetical protein
MSFIMQSFDAEIFVTIGVSADRLLDNGRWQDIDKG